MFPTGVFNVGPMNFLSDGQSTSMSFVPEQFGGSTFNSQNFAQHHQIGQSSGHSLPAPVNSYPGASGPYKPDQLPISTSSLNQQMQLRPLPESSQYYDYYGSRASRDENHHGHYEYYDLSQGDRILPIPNAYSQQQQQFVVSPDQTGFYGGGFQNELFPNLEVHRQPFYNDYNPVYERSIQDGDFYRRQAKLSTHPPFQVKQERLPHEGDRKLDSNRQNQFQDYQYGLAQFQQPISDPNILPKSSFGGADSDSGNRQGLDSLLPWDKVAQNELFHQNDQNQDKRNHRRSKRNNSDDQASRPPSAYVELSANIDRIFEKSSKEHRHGASKGISPLNTTSSSLLPFVQSSTVADETIERKQSSQQPQSTASRKHVHKKLHVSQNNFPFHSSSHSIDTRTAIVDSIATKRQNEREEIAISLLNSMDQPLLSIQSWSSLRHTNSEQTSQLTQSSTKKTILPSDKTDHAPPNEDFKKQPKSVNASSDTDCSYLWFRRIKEIFLLMGNLDDTFSQYDMELAREDMIRTCEEYLENQRPRRGVPEMTKEEQQQLDEWKIKKLHAETFRMSYVRKKTNPGDEKVKKQVTQTELSRGELPIFNNPIWWYSCNEAPIYNQMNNILRLQSFELLMCHRYFISDLCQRIEQWYAQNKPSEEFKVYRADRLSVADLQSIIECQKRRGALTMNGFISTSRSKDISLSYVKTQQQRIRNDDLSIMYEITIDPKKSLPAYADIEKISFHPREKEVLFNIGSRFRINEIPKHDETLNVQWIKLTAEDINSTLLEEIRTIIKQSSQPALSILLARYLMEIGEEPVSQRYLNQIITNKQLVNDPNLASAYNCLGTICLRQGLYFKALEYYRQALNTQGRLQLSNDNAMAEIFNNIGETRLGLNELDEAQENLKEGIRIQKRESKKAQQYLPSLLYNMGRVAYAQLNYDEAEEYFQKSLKLLGNVQTSMANDALEKRLLKAELFIAIGHLERAKDSKDSKDSKETNENFEKAVKIYESTLPHTHSKVVETRINIFCENVRNNWFKLALKSYELLQPLLEAYEAKQTTSQQDLANLYAMIGTYLVQRQEFDNAMKMWKKAIKHEQQTFLDRILPSAQVSKIKLDRYMVQRAYRSTLEYYSKGKTDQLSEYYGILYAKLYDYDRAIRALQEQSSILLANLWILKRNFKEGVNVYKKIVNKEIVNKENIDISTVGLVVQMLTTKGISPDEYLIEQLAKADHLGNKFSGRDIRLRVIINDSLAEAYLSLKKYAEALKHTQISIELKQQEFSSDHLSLSRNYEVIASSAFSQRDYGYALQYYRRVAEIQAKNIINDHRDIRSFFFLIGDCYCKMGNSDSAERSYDQAQESNDNDTEDEENSEQDVQALIRMHSNLAEMIAKEKKFARARSHEAKTIQMISEEILPRFIEILIDDEDHSSVKFEHIQTALEARLNLKNGKTFLQVLKNVVFIDSSLARALFFEDGMTNDEEVASDIYEQAINLNLKLITFAEGEERDLLKLYAELSNAYEKSRSDMPTSIRADLVGLFDQTAKSSHQQSLEFYLGNLYSEERNFFKANHHFNQVLEKFSDDQKTAKTILENLIKNNEKNFSKNIESLDDTAEESNANEEDETDQSSEHDETSSRTQSISSEHNQPFKSLNDEETVETNKYNVDQLSHHNESSSQAQSAKSSTGTLVVEKENPKAKAYAYSQLRDNKNALKHFNKYIDETKRSFKESWPKSIDRKKLPVVSFFLPLIQQNITLAMSSPPKAEDISDGEVWTDLLQCYTKIFKIAGRMGDSSNSVKRAYFTAFCICKKLHRMPEKFLQAVDLLLESNPDELQWKKLIPLLEYNQLTVVLMRIAAYYISMGCYNDACEVYLVLQKTLQNHEIWKSAVNYGLLKVFDLYSVADKKYRLQIEAIDIHSSTIPLFDRVRLTTLIASFMKDLKDETAEKEFNKKSMKLRMEPWNVADLEKTDCIGGVLVKVQDYYLARLYWEELRDTYHAMLPNFIVKRLYSRNFNFEDILRAVQEMDDDLLSNTSFLAESYKSLASYEGNDGDTGDASESLQKAIVIWSKIPGTETEVTAAQKKINTWKKNDALPAQK